jgi:universal stress protein A
MSAQRHYRHILFATDFSEQAIMVGERAKHMAQLYNARLTLLHVVEEVNISAGYELMPLLPEVPDEQTLLAANESLTRLAQRLGLEASDRQVVTAVSTKEGILEAAVEHHADLIVVGSHGRHGFALLLGSTANAVMHGAPCDVLAVRIQEKC